METPHAAFDNDKYIALQSAAIRERAERFGNKLYLEIGSGESCSRTCTPRACCPASSRT